MKPVPSSRRGPPRPPDRQSRAFTLVELMIGAALSAFILAGVMSTFLFLGRSRANVPNYNEMEAQARTALAYFADDTRQASDLTWSSSTSVSLMINGAAVSYTYDDGAKTFTRTDSATTRVLVRGITLFAFKAYDINGTPLALDSAGALATAGQSTKQLQISVAAARTNTTVVAATDNVLSARFILRNKKVTT